MNRQRALGLLASALLVSACAGDATEPTRDAIFADAGASSGSDTGLTGDDASAPGEDAGATEDAAGPGPIEDAGSTGDTSGPGPVEDTGPADTGTPQDTGSTPDTGSPGSDDYVPLFTSATPLEPANIYVDGDTIVTHIADRGRDRHAREDQYQNYDHYLPLYWEHRTTRLRIEDQVASGGQIEVSVVSEWKLSIAEFRAWYLGRGTVATYSGNYAAGFTEEGPGTFDASHTLVSNAGDQYRYRFTIENALTLDGQVVPLEVGQRMEIELSQFLDAPPRGRATTTARPSSTAWAKAGWCRGRPEAASRIRPPIARTPSRSPSAPGRAASARPCLTGTRMSRIAPSCRWRRTSRT